MFTVQWVDVEHKNFPVEIKAEGDAGDFTALVSVFGNVDLGGDRMIRGAFTKTLRRFKEQDKPIPIILSHQHDDVMAHIGKADPKEARQTEQGLVLKGSLDILDNPVAKQTYKLMKEKRLTDFSFGYTVPEGGQKIADDGANEVSEVDLIEAGPTLKGMNPEAQLQAVKSLELAEKQATPDDSEFREETSKEEPPLVVEDEEREEPQPAKRSPQDLLRQKVRRMKLNAEMRL